MDIRKISIGADYKSGSFKIWIERNQELIMWKEFKSTMPVSVEYNLNF